MTLVQWATRPENLVGLLIGLLSTIVLIWSLSQL